MKDIKDLKVFRENYHKDNRGITYTLWKSEWSQGVLSKIIEGKKGALRGFHGDQHTWKLFACIKGSFLLVVIDLRPDSPTYLQKQQFKLTEKNKKYVLVPPGCINAHQGLSPYMLYYTWSEPYNIDVQVTVKWNDPRIGIKWPLKPILSERDKNGISLEEFQWPV